MRSRADVVVVGAGVVGLSIAYHLCKRGLTNVVVLDKTHLNGGASGRCGGGIRAQWGTKENILLAKESIRFFERINTELGCNTFFRQGGYLFLAFTKEQAEQLEKNVRLQNSLGVKSRMLSPEEAKEIVPALSVERVLAASFHDKDGVIFPWPVVWGFAERVKEMGGEICEHTRVVGIDAPGGRVKRVKTDRGEIETRVVVNVAGPWSAEIAKMVGVELPITPVRHEIMVTEPIKPFLDPMLVSLETGLYLSQTMRGELIGGVSIPDERPGIQYGSTLLFLRRMARVVTELLPQAAKLRVLRQWAGHYDMTPDAKPILGDVDGFERFIQANGFSGHGFMISPAVGRLISELIVDGKPSMSLEPFSLERFLVGKVEREKVVIG
ncbi:MAG: FAD-dependent oxidoreductase [Methanobacteriota archaeon]|nr:MAG: FAD-dependent oxidoreductase [Euryarchaeota archaeon]